jgi:hypothetical protein
VDFIFGSATASFEHCHIHCLRDGYITAASTPDNQPFGFVFSACKITGDRPEVRTYLGHPWRVYASTTFLHTEMSEVVRPEGWNNWRKPEAERTARYAEFNSVGPGANPAGRVKWAKQLTTREAKTLTPKNVLRATTGGIRKQTLSQMMFAKWLLSFCGLHAVADTKAWRTWAPEVPKFQTALQKTVGVWRRRSVKIEPD